MNAKKSIINPEKFILNAKKFIMNPKKFIMEKWQKKEPKSEGIKTVKFRPDVKAEEVNWIQKRRNLADKRNRRLEKDSKTPYPHIQFKSNEDLDNVESSLVGLGLSGGGIRSATFNLGLLQALERWKLLGQIDYLSTVSGGGYIGSALTWFKSKLTFPKKGVYENNNEGNDNTEKPSLDERLSTNYPFGIERADYTQLGGRVLRWLRDHGNYLAPGNGLNVWALIAATLTGTLVNLMVLLPFLALTILILMTKIGRLPLLPNSLTIFDVFLYGGYLLLLAFGIYTLVFAFATGVTKWQPSDNHKTVHTAKRKNEKNDVQNKQGVPPKIFDSKIYQWLEGRYPLLREVKDFRDGKISRYDLARHLLWSLKARIVMGRLIMWGLIFILIGTIPIVHTEITENFGSWYLSVTSIIPLSGIIAIAGSLFGSKDHVYIRGLRSIFLSLGLALLCYGVVLWTYHLMYVPTPWKTHFIWLFLAACLSYKIAEHANVNHVSMHRYYRNRLKEAYMPEKIPSHPDEKDDTEDEKSCGKRFKFDALEAENFYLHKIPETDAPYHIINTNVHMVGSEDVKLRKRGGDSFIFSPKYSGAASTGYLNTKDHVGGTMNLATAMAISGAAVNPNTCYTRSRPLTFLMTMLNLRLGYWIRNPSRPSERLKGRSRPKWYGYMFMEMFGQGLSEEHKHVHLSDGGHFDNLGLYELIRRRCRYIIISDAGADPKFSFSDLAKTMEMARVDFGAKIKFDGLEKIVPNSSGTQRNKNSETAFVLGKITYASRQEKYSAEPEQGDIIYIKSTLIDGLPEDIYSYRRSHPNFPDTPTINQVYDEQGFEAYRELGFSIGRKLCGSSDVLDLEALISTLRDKGR